MLSIKEKDLKYNLHSWSARADLIHLLSQRLTVYISGMRTARNIQICLLSW